SLGTFAAPPPAPPSARPSVAKARTQTPTPSPTPAAKKSPTTAAGARDGAASPIAPGSLVGPGDRCGQLDRIADQVSLTECNGSAAQHWTQPGDATLRVQGRCLDVRDGAVVGDPVPVNACDGTSSQRWDLRGDGTLFNGFANLCAS